MIINCHININSEWQYLPWKQINGRVLLIQKKIFEASKQNNLKILNKAKNTLLNSSEVKLFAINKIINNIDHYYSNEKYLLKDIDKFYIFKYMFYTNILLKTKVKFFVEKIKEYLIFLCLEPEWKARLKQYYSLENKIEKQQYLSSKKNIENLNWNKLISHNKFSPYISNYIYYWIKNKFFVYNKYYIFQYLPSLLLKIYQLNEQWYLYKLQKVNYNCHSLNNKYINNQNKISYNTKQKYYLNKVLTCLVSIIRNIKSRLYKKDTFNRLRFNRQLSWFYIINQVTFILQVTIFQYIYLVTYLFIDTLINKINFLLSYLKVRKNYHSVILPSNYYNLDLYIILYKKAITSFLYKYLFKIDR